MNFRRIVLLCLISLSLSGCMGGDNSFYYDEDEDYDSYQEDEDWNDINMNEEDTDFQDEYSQNDKLYYWYNTLSNDGKKLYKEMVVAIINGEKSLVPKENYNIEESDNMLEIIYYDHPELFWFAGSGIVWSTGTKISKIEFDYNDLYNDLENNKSKFEESIKKLLNNTDGANIYEEERNIHDYLANLIDYKYGKYDQTAFSALVNNKAVCAGYTRAFQLLMHKKSVPCYYVAGEAIDENGKWDSHSWNIIYLDNNYYYVDLTWNDHTDANYISYEYYNITDKEIEKNHRKGEKFKEMPKCNSKNCSFENLYGESKELAVAKQFGAKSPMTINKIDDYYDLCYKGMIKNGKGNYSLYGLVYGDKLKERITNSIETSEENDKWFYKAIDEMNISWNGCTGEYVFYPVGEEVYLLVRTIRIN